MSDVKSSPANDMEAGNTNDLLHVAIIMDGNGRWAKAQNKERTHGHVKGVETVERIVESSIEMGVKYLTLYTFSTENWIRPLQERTFLFSLLAKNLLSQIPKLKKNGVCLRTIGDTSAMPLLVRNRLKKAVRETEHNDKLYLTLAINYSTTWEIIKAVKDIGKQMVDKKLSVDDINDDVFKQYLSTADMPDPDLLIRTGGTCRISNFLLYQIAYAELHFTDPCWPALSKEEYSSILQNFFTRTRTFGGVIN